MGRIMMRWRPGTICLIVCILISWYSRIICNMNLACDKALVAVVWILASLSCLSLLTRTRGCFSCPDVVGYFIYALRFGGRDPMYVLHNDLNPSLSVSQVHSRKLVQLTGPFLYPE